MEQYKLSMQGHLTIVEQKGQPFKMSVQKERKLPADSNTALIEATLYREECVFAKNGSYIFEALDKDNQPLKTDVDVDCFKAAVNFFFTGLLNTDLFEKYT